MKYVLVAGLLGLLFFAGTKMRKHKGETMDTSEKRVDHMLGEFDGRMKDLRHKAEKVRGEARSKLQEQMHELEAKQKELRGRLEELGSEARRVLERARA